MEKMKIKQLLMRSGLSALETDSAAGRSALARIHKTQQALKKLQASNKKPPRPTDRARLNRLIAKRSPAPLAALEIKSRSHLASLAKMKHKASQKLLARAHAKNKLRSRRVLSVSSQQDPEELRDLDDDSDLRQMHLVDPTANQWDDDQHKVDVMLSHLNREVQKTNSFVSPVIKGIQRRYLRDE